ncbi:MAG TPA: type 4a pilus biogenesis protein PilO [Terriglobales bacterium]|nr:type 4a pilus biogenesis protein PilO [Terriglobales bacterium]
MSAGRQYLIMIVVVALVTGAAWYFVWQPQQQANDQAQAALDAKNQQIASLNQLRDKERELDDNIAKLQQQLQQMAAIVPDKKEVESFIHLLEDKAQEAGITVRRYTAQPLVTREFYSEVPFEVELDGQYYQMLNFFDRVGRLERIVNITNLQLAGVADRRNIKGLKKNYTYGPSESVVALCQAVTFFSPEGQAGAAPGAAGPPGQQPGAPPRR